MVALPMLITVAILVSLGVLLMILETFVPGLVAGILGAVCVLAAVALLLVADDFSHWPSWARTVTACSIVALTAVLQLIWLRFFAVKFWSKSFTLQAAVPPAPTPQKLNPGTEGVALTELRPLGRAEFGGMRCEVRCEDGFAPAGTRVRITGSEPGNLLVRLLSPANNTPNLTAP